MKKYLNYFELLKLNAAGNVVKLKDVGFNPKKGLAYGNELGELDLAKISQEQADQIIALGKEKIDLELLIQFSNLFLERPVAVSVYDVILSYVAC